MFRFFRANPKARDPLVQFLLFALAAFRVHIGLWHFQYQRVQMNFCFFFNRSPTEKHITRMCIVNSSINNSLKAYSRCVLTGFSGEIHAMVVERQSSVLVIVQLCTTCWAHRRTMSVLRDVRELKRIFRQFFFLVSTHITEVSSRYFKW